MTTPMKVSFLIATVHDIGGTAGAVVTQANALARRGVEVEILSVFPPEGGTHFPLGPGVVVRDLVDDSLASLRGRTPLLIPDNADPGLDARVDAALEGALPALRSDVLVTVTPAMLSYAVQLAPVRTVVVHQEHRSSASRPNSRQLLLDIARRADVVAMLTEPMAHWLQVELGADCPEVVVVPNALAPGYRPRSPLTEPVILGVGRLASEKQWPVLVRAFGAVADRIPEWRLRIFGEGHGRFETMGMVRKLGLYDRVELPGPTSDMQAEWARASMSALTSQAGEGFPLVIQEAMAAGVPVVAYDMPTGPRDQIDHGVDGLLVTQGAEAALSAAILRLATDRPERQRMGAAALAKAATWSGGAIADRWIEVFETAIGRRRATGAAGRTAAVGHVDAVVLHQDRAPLGREGTGVTPAQARHETLAAATGLATSLGDLARGWFVVPGRLGAPTTVVVPMLARAAYVVGLAGDGVLPDYVSVHDPEHRGWPSRRGTAAEMVAPLAQGRTGRLLLEPWPRTDGPEGERGTLLGRGCAVAVEFWETGPDGDLHAVPGHVTWTTSVPRDAVTVPITVHEVEVPTLPLMAAPSVYDVRFPVDVVYTWVDGSDGAWDERRLARLVEVSADPTTQTRASSGRARYVDRGELRYSLRSLHLFAPWVRRIHLVTDGQVPAWLDPDDPRINLVDHRDLLPPDALPTFNSHAIESVLHRIEGLAEHFLYVNDDFFVGAPTWPEAFFSAAGSPAVFASSTVVGLPGHGVLPWALAADNNRRLLSEAFGATTVNTLVHAPYAHRVSTLTEVAERFAEAVDATTRSPFRSATDVSMLSSLAQHHGLLTGQAHLGEADYAFVDITETVVRRRLIALMDRDRGGFCLGDSHDFGRDPAQVEQLVADFLEAYFPIAAPWER